MAAPSPASPASPAPASPASPASLSLKRLIREAKENKANPMPGIKIFVSSETIYQWTAEVAGPQGSPYEKGLFLFEIRFSLSYPFVPPKVQCKTRIFHCNINTNGDICLDLLKNKWTPLLTTQSVLIAVQQLLAEPNPDDPLMLSVAKILVSDPKEHNRRAKLWTARYASSK